MLDEARTEAGNARSNDQPDDQHARDTHADQRQNETLVEIHALAHKFARRLCSADTADDIAQDVVLKCLEQMRLGIWDMGESPHKNLPGLIRQMIKCQRIDRRRAETAAAERDAAYARTSGRESWSGPELALEEREATRLFHDVLDAFPWQWRVAYVLVRDRKLTYKEAAEYLDVDISSVRAYLVHIRRAFRRRLLERGILPPPPVRGRAASSKSAVGGAAVRGPGSYAEACAELTGLVSSISKTTAASTASVPPKIAVPGLNAPTSGS